MHRNFKSSCQSWKSWTISARLDAVHDDSDQDDDDINDDDNDADDDDDFDLPGDTINIWCFSDEERAEERLQANLDRDEELWSWWFPTIMMSNDDDFPW